MSDGLNMVRLGDVLTLQRGFDLPKKNRQAGNIPLVSSPGISDFQAEIKVQPPAVITGRYGTLGKVFYLEEPCFPLNTTLWVKDFKGNHPKFCKYLLETIDYYSCSDKAAVPGVNRNHLEELLVRKPDLLEQHKIAHILGTLDEKIELNQKKNQTLKESSKAIFKSWFVDFDPVRTKAEGRPTGLHSEISDMFPDGLGDSEIGEIPKGWGQVKVEDLCDYVSSGGTPARKNPEYWENGEVDWFKTGELLDSPLLDASEKITDLGIKKSAAKLWDRHTVLFAIYASPTVGRLGYLTKKGSCNQAAAGLVAKEDVGMPFLYWTLFNARKELQNIAVGAAQQNINVGILKTHKCLRPPANLMRKFSELGLAIESQREILAKENAVITELRDMLLPKLVSGELRLPNAEKFLEKAGV